MNKVPKLRFPEFQGEWEEKKLGKLGDFFKGSTLSKSNLSEYGKPCILYGELYTKYGEVIKDIVSKTNLDSKNLVVGNKNDVLIPSSGESAIDIATASCLQEGDVLLGGDLNVFRPYKENGIFISYQLNNSKRKEIAKLAQGASVVHIYNEQLKKIKIDIPREKEQEKIASFFSLIDKKIEKQKQKIEALEEYKKGMMQKIFSQEIRFKDQNGNEFPKWKEKNLGELCTINKGEQINKLDLSSHGNYYALNGGIEPSGYTKNWNTNENTISISEGGASCGYVKFNFEKFWSGGHCYTLKEISEDIYNKYLYQYLKFSELSIMALRVGSGLPNIQKSALTIFKVNIPNIAEQQKITNILSKFEEKIAKEQKKLEELQKLKKGLLQQMFV